MALASALRAPRHSPSPRRLPVTLVISPRGFVSSAGATCARVTLSHSNSAHVADAWVFVHARLDELDRFVLK